MTTDQIKCFLTAARTQNFTKAAKELFLTQPAISKQIAALEEEMGVMLFSREDNIVRLTTAGRIFAQGLPELCEKFQTLMADVKAADAGYVGTLHIGSIEGQWFGAAYTELIRRFMAEQPGILLHLTQGSYAQLEGQLQSGTLDLILIPSYGEIAPWLTSRSAGTVPGYLVCSAHLPDDPAALTNYPLLLPDPQDSLSAYRYGCELRQTLGLESAVETAPNPTTLLHWVEAGRGLGMVSSLSSILANPMVRIVRDLPPIEHSWIWNPGRQNSALLQFLDFIGSTALGSA